MPNETTLTTIRQAQQGRCWVILDAEGKILGRLASHAAGLLRGKHKRFFTPSVDCGDFVVVTNAAKVCVSGAKMEQKFYFRHSGYAKGKKIIPYKLQMERDPREVIYLAVKRMLPVNKLRAQQLTRLKIYPGPAHPHAAQISKKPQEANHG
ncbi:MAG: 50S ribosomal protein L13 [Elusimicrobia bacterium]|nr:50S ribosomal protein L13 [Elusimicrobiota bacterium]